MGKVVSSRIVVCGSDWLRTEAVSVTISEASENVGCETETVLSTKGCWDMVENAVLDETNAGVIEDLDWDMLTSAIVSDLTEEAELVCKKLVTWAASWLEWVLLVLFGTEVNKSCNCVFNLVVIASLEEMRTETTELGEGVLFSIAEVTGELKVDASRYPEELASLLPFRVGKVAIDGTS